MTQTLPVAERSTTTSPRQRMQRRRTGIGPLMIVSGQGGPERGALHVAELLARRDRVNAHVVGLLRPVDVSRWVLGAADAAALQDGLRRQRRERLRRQVHETVGRSIFFSTEVLLGNSMQALRDAAMEKGAGYVLVGLDEANAPDRILTERRVLQIARVVGRPVIAVPRGCTALPMRALVAVSGDASSERAAHAAARVLAPGGTLVLAHVAPERSGTGLATDDTLDQRGGHAVDRVAQVASALRAVRDITIETVILHGEPATALPELATRRECDLVACGSRRGSARRGPGIGSTTAAVLSGAPGAVLIAPPDETIHGRNASQARGGVSSRPPATAALAARNDFVINGGVQ